MASYGGGGRGTGWRAGGCGEGGRMEERPAGLDGTGEVGEGIRTTSFPHSEDGEENITPVALVLSCYCTVL